MAFLQHEYAIGLRDRPVFAVMGHTWPAAADLNR
jgi:hypothetical protein